MASSAAQNYISLDVLLNCSYAMIAVVSGFAIVRIAIRMRRPKALAVEDVFVFLSYLCFLVQTILYIRIAKTIYRVSDVISGKTPPYAGLEADAMQQIRVFFANTLLFWCTLWLVKGSLLSLYRKLLGSKRQYWRLWWAIVAFCAITFVGAVISHFTSCSSMSAWFTVGGCATPRDSRAQIISLYYAFAVDVLSDLMVMILPIGLVWNLQMSFTKKTGIVALFCVGLVAIATAIIRVVSIGVRAGSSTPSSTWLAFWGIIETGVAVIIGTAPGLYSTARTAHTSRKESKYVGHHNGYLRHTGDLPSNHSEGIKSKTTSNPLSTVSFDDDEQGIVQQSTVSGKSADQTTLFSRPSYLQPTTKTTNRELDDSMEMTPRSEWSSSNIFITKNFAVKKW